MTKRLIVLLVLAVMLCMAGCDSIGIDVEDIHGSPSPQAGGEDTAADTPTPQTTPEAGTPQPTPQASTPQPTPEASTPQPTPEASTPEPTEPVIVEDDFTITTQGLTIAVGMDPAPVINALGAGGIDGNNDGFIGWDESNQHKIYRRDYDGFALFIKTEVASGISAVSQIAITGDTATHRGVAPGDTYDDMIAAYGEPDREKSDEGMTDCTYLFGERSIIFVLNDAGVIGYIDIH